MCRLRSEKNKVIESGGDIQVAPEGVGERTAVCQSSLH
jgi:hypothetical protein